MTDPDRPSTRYGWVPDLPDHRDHMMFAAAPAVADLPAAVDLRAGCPATIYDQAQLGSCTANAIAAAVEYARIKQGQPTTTPSRLFIYYNERVMEHTVASDAGASLRDGIKSVAKQGVCPETSWPYKVTRFTARPPAACYSEALTSTATGYQRINQTLPELKACLAGGFPIVFGFAVYRSFETQQVARTGTVPMPSGGERSLGGHAVLAVGYDDQAGRFLVRNSWGAGWGAAGYFTMPYAYLTNQRLASDFWAVLGVS